MATELEIQRAKPDEMDETGRTFQKRSAQYDHSAQSLQLAASSLREATSGLSFVALDFLLSRHHNSLVKQADELDQAQRIVGTYADEVEALKARYKVAKIELDDAEASYAKHGSAHAALLDVYEGALSVGSSVAGFLGADDLADDMRKSEARYEAAENRMEGAHQAMTAILDDYEQATQRFALELRSLDFVYDSIRVNLDDPDLAEHDDTRDSYAWDDFWQLPLFGSDDEIDVNDIRQGGLGDCYFLTGLVGMADTAQGREAIRKMIERNPDGTFTVHFADGDEVVDGDLPVDGGVGAYGRTDGLGGYWVAIMEKAYAQKHGNYEEIEGGYPDDVLRDSFGLDTSSHGVGDEEYSDLVKALRDGSPAALAFDINDVDSGYDDGSNHALAILRSESHGGERRFLVSNPWNSNFPVELPGGRTVDLGGRQWITEAEMKELAYELYY